MIKTVSIHTTGVEAHIVRCRLEHEGIPSFVAFEHHIWAMWSNSLALGGVRVQVPGPYFESALRVVNNIQLGQYETELNTDELKPYSHPCPVCRSTKTQANNSSSNIALVALFIFNIPLPFTQHKNKCESCLYSWIAHNQRGYPLLFLFVILILATVSLLLFYELWYHLCQLHCENPYSLFPYPA